MSQEQDKQVISAIVNALNTRQFEALAGKAVSRDLIYTQNGNTGDLNKWLQDFRNCVVSFPDVRLTIESQEVVNDQVITNLTITGTHLGPLGEIPPTGKSFKVHITLISRMKDGVMIEWSEKVDDMAMAQQLGLIPNAVEETIGNR